MQVSVKVKYDKRKVIKERKKLIKDRGEEVGGEVKNSLLYRLKCKGNILAESLN